MCDLFLVVLFADTSGLSPLLIYDCYSDPSKYDQEYFGISIGFE